MTWAVGVDLGGTNARAALVDTAAKTAAPSEQRWQHQALDPEAVASSVASVVAELAGPEVPLGLGIAAMLGGDTGVVVNAPNLGWRDVDFRGLLAARLPGREIRLVNDVGAIALGEGRWGAARGSRAALCVFAGTGIGGGILIEGRLYNGASGVAAEFGHTKVVLGPTARLCGCGQRGCIEAYAGGRMLAERVAADLDAGTQTAAAALAAGEDVHGGHLDQAARAGDPYALSLWDEIAPLFGQALANAVTLLNPSHLVIGGTVLWGAPFLRERVMASYQALVGVAAGPECRIVQAELGDAAGLLGAAVAAVS
jgi:glucokinase